VQNESVAASDELVLTTGEVAALLRLSDVTVRRLVRRGVLPRVPGLRVMLIPADAVHDLASGRTVRRGEPGR
jgi:excisionase family DNA binding protein